MEATAHRAWVLLSWGEGLAGKSASKQPLEQALALGEKLGMPEVVARARTALGDAVRPERAKSLASPTPAFSLSRDARGWSLTHAGRSFVLKDVRGLGMLKKLVDSPERELHVLDLASDPSAEGPGPIDLGDAGEVIDARARKAYKARIAELRADVDEAERCADTVRVSRLRYELDALTDQIAGAVGLGGRERRSGSAAERARIVVQRRVREAIKKITDQDPELGRHLDWTVRTGTFCAYEPAGRRVTP